MKIKEDGIVEVDEFCSNYFEGRKILGIHYRGTDRKAEVKLVSYDKMTKNISKYLVKYPNTNSIFIPTDDMNFIKYLENSKIDRTDSFRSTNDKVIHHSIENVYDINRGAIINCLIMARCSVLMKTASILSSWSKLFNSSLPLVMLSVPNSFQREI